MHILHSLFNELKEEFSKSKKGAERGPWFTYTATFWCARRSLADLVS